MSRGFNLSEDPSKGAQGFIDGYCIWTQGIIKGEISVGRMALTPVLAYYANKSVLFFRGLARLVIEKGFTAKVLLGFYNALPIEKPQGFGRGCFLRYCLPRKSMINFINDKP